MANILGEKKVNWHYDNVRKKTTKCIIEDKDGTILATGEAKRFHTDNYDKKVARKITFARAMSDAVQTGNIPKEERTALWADFRTKINQPE